MILELMKIKMNKYPNFHPITQTYVNDIKKCYRNTSFFIQFDPNNLQNIQNVKNLLQKFYLTESERLLFGGGSCNVRKSRTYLWASKDKIKLFIGVNSFQNCVYIKYIRRKYKMVHDQASRSQDKFSEIVIVNLNDTQKFPAKLQPNGKYEFSNNLTRLISMCNNKENLRSINACSHAVSDNVNPLQFIDEVDEDEHENDDDIQIESDNDEEY